MSGGAEVVAKLAGGVAALALVVGVGGMVLLGPEQFGAKLSGLFGPTVIDDGDPAWAAKARDPKWRQKAVEICDEVDGSTHNEVTDTFLRRGDETGGLADEEQSAVFYDMLAPTNFAKAYDKAGFAENERRLADRMCVFYKLAGREMIGVMMNTLGDDPSEYRAGYADPNWVADGSQDQRLGKRFHKDYGFDRAVQESKVDYGNWAILPDEALVTASMDTRLDADLISDGWNKKSHQTTVRALRYAYDTAVAQSAENQLKMGNVENLIKLGQAAKARGDLP